MEAVLELKRICNDLGVQNFSKARDLLESRVREIRVRLGKLEVSKKRIAEESKKDPDDEELKEEIKSLSIRQTEFKKSSNLSVVSHELKILENVSTVLNLMPSVIDYAVNIGLKETSNEWIQYLSENGSLSSDVHLESILVETHALNQEGRFRI